VAHLTIPAHRIGIFFTGWDAPAAQARARREAAGQTVNTVEDVLRSNGAAKVSDLLYTPGEYNNAAAFHYHVTPSLGPSCLYRARPGQTGVYADCPNISQAARFHADQLRALDVDFVLIDATNLDTFSAFSDGIQLRPAEVLFEEWAALRAQGVVTPQLAIWANIGSANADLYSKDLDLYNDPRFSDLVMRDTKTGKKLMFVVDPGRQDLFNAIQSNGGRNDVTAVWMWGNMDGSKYAAGRWSFMSPCRTPSGEFTTYFPTGSCDQLRTTNSPVGSQLAVSLSYQVGFASVPFQASGKLEGFTLRRQFEAAFAQHVDYLFLNGWNEVIAQPQTDTQGGGSMGLEYEPANAPLKGRQWVDTYGVEFDRAMMPTKEEGTRYTDLVASCVRVYRSGHATCDLAGEACCQAADPFVTVYSLKETGGDFLPTTSAAEKNALVGQGNWKERCTPYGGTPYLCTQNGDTAGPFRLYSAAGTNRAALNRCLFGVNHFLSTSANCEGQVVEGALGFISTVKTSATPRPLARCLQGAFHSHSTTGTCPAGTTTEFILGYVR